MDILYKKDKIVLTNNKAYVLVYEKEFCQGSSTHEDSLGELHSVRDYEEAYNSLDEKILEIDSCSEKENKDDENSIWYNKNVKYSFDEIFKVNTVSAEFNDYKESIKVLEFDIDLSEIELDKIKSIYVSKDTRKSQVSERKKTLIIETEDDTFYFPY